MTLRKLVDYFRIQDWWKYLIPPILSFYFIGLLISAHINKTFISIIFDVSTIFLLSIFIASFGFFLNEWTDIKDDAIAHKANRVVDLSLRSKWLIFAILLLSIYSLISIIKWNRTSTLLLCFVQLALLVLYSVKPFRLKRNKYAAVVLDALYSGTLFYIIGFNIGSATIVKEHLIYFIFIWGFCRGIRNIIHHLIKDKSHDEALDFKTMATSMNIDKLKQITLWFLLPVETIIFLLILYFVPFNYILMSSFVLYCLYTFFRKNYKIPLLLKRTSPIESNTLTEINLYYEKYLPFLTLMLLVYTDARLIVVLVFYIFMFYGNTLIQKMKTVL